MGNTMVGASADAKSTTDGNKNYAGDATSGKAIAGDVVNKSIAIGGDAKSGSAYGGKGGSGGDATNKVTVENNNGTVDSNNSVKGGGLQARRRQHVQRPGLLTG